MKMCAGEEEELMFKHKRPRFLNSYFTKAG
jgi:hypothetical protein